MSNGESGSGSGGKDGKRSDTFEISVTEFNRLQGDMMNLKTLNYDWKKKYEVASKKLKNSQMSLRISVSKYEKENKKLRSVIKRSKDKQMIQKLSSRLEEMENNTSLYQQQNQGLKKNIQLMMKEGEKVKQTLRDEKRSKEKLEVKLIEILKNQREGNTQKTDDSTGVKKETNVVIDKDLQNSLLSTIDRLKETHQNFIKQKKIELDNLQQQNRVLHGKNEGLDKENKSFSDKVVKLSLEVQSYEKKLAESKKIIENSDFQNKTRISAVESKWRQQLTRMVNQKREELQSAEKEMKSKHSKEISRSEKSFKSKLSEEYQRFQRLFKKKKSHQKKKKEYKFQVNELQKRSYKVKKELKELKEKLQLNEKKTLDYEKKIEILKTSSRNFKDAFNNERKETDDLKLEKKKFTSLLKDYKKSMRSKDGNVKKLTRELDELKKRRKQRIRKDISQEVHTVFQKLIIRDERETKDCFNEKLTKIETQYDISSKKLVEFEDENVLLKQQVVDKAKEKEISQKSNKRLIRELRNHLKLLKKKVKDLQQKLSTSKPEVSKVENVQSPLKTDNEPDDVNTPKKNQVHHVRTLSGEGSELISSSENINKYIQQLQKDNEQLIKKYTGAQQTVWDLEEKKRVLDTQILQYQEEFQKKNVVLRDYIRREKLGRLEPEIEKNRRKIHEKKQSLMEGIFGKKTDVGSKKGKSKEQYENHVHRLVEETLLKNIQMQSNIKIMGEEVSRLLAENRTLKKMIRNLSNKKL